HSSLSADDCLSRIRSTLPGSARLLPNHRTLVHRVQAFDPRLSAREGARAERARDSVTLPTQTMDHDRFPRLALPSRQRRARARVAPALTRVMPVAFHSRAIRRSILLACCGWRIRICLTISAQAEGETVPPLRRSWSMPSSESKPRSNSRGASPARGMKLEKLSLRW